MVYLNKDQIIKEYVEDKDSTYIIAKRYHTYPNHILRKLKEWGVPIRGYSEQQKLVLDRGIRKHSTRGRPRPDYVKKKISETKILKKTIGPQIQIREFLYNALQKSGVHILKKYNKLFGSNIETFDLYIPEKKTVIVISHIRPKQLQSISVIFVNCAKTAKKLDDLMVLYYEVLGALSEQQPFVEIEVNDGKIKECN